MFPSGFSILSSFLDSAPQKMVKYQFLKKIQYDIQEI